LDEAKDLSSRSLLWGGAVVAGLGALVLSEGVLTSAFGEEALAVGGGPLAQRGRLILLGLAALLGLAGWNWPDMGRRTALVMLSFSLTVVGFEAFAGPFVGRDTTIFMRDQELGWRLRPGASDLWLGADVVVNAHGMRGEAPREDAEQSVLFLGDSVVFGAFIEHDSETVPAQTNASLAAKGRDVQCLNAGVGGWSPWQERLWYEREGALLGAEVVLVHLVLNDATEPLVLERHGGGEEGFQLDRTRASGWLHGTNWATALRRWRRSAQGEGERLAAARAEALGVYELLRAPSLPASRRAWELHLTEVGALVDSIRAQGATPVVVSHPYTVQFEAPGLWWPQDAVDTWCSLKGISHLDVGRAVAAARPEPIGAYHDAVHPNRDGAALLGEVIATFLLGEGLVH
jgi:hypothetical protein